jgi:hypothetical protein
MAAKRLTLREFRPLLWELWDAGEPQTDWAPEATEAAWNTRRPARWTKKAAEAAWNRRRGKDGFPDQPWREMADSTWQDRLRELNRNPRPPEVDPQRMEREIRELRYRLAHPIVLDPVYAGPSSYFASRSAPLHRDLEAEHRLAQLEAELALRRRLGPPKLRRRGRGKKAAKP